MNSTPHGAIKLNVALFENCERNPDGPWLKQQARNLVMGLADRGKKASYPIRVGESKFTEKFNVIFKSEGSR